MSKRNKNPNDIPPYFPPYSSKATRIFPARSRSSLRGFLFAHLPVDDRKRQIIFESHPEKKTLLLLLAQRDIFDIWDQPPPVSYMRPNGKRGTHTFDYLATFKSGQKIAIAVKPSDRADRLNFRGELAAIEASLPTSFANKVVLVTEKNLDPVAVRNATLLHLFRQTPDPEADVLVSNYLADLHDPIRLGDLASQPGLGARGFRAGVRAIFAGLAKIEPDARICYSTPLFPTSLLEVAG